MSQAVLAAPPEPVVQPADHRRARLAAMLFGVLGAVLALATPFLPVSQTTAEVNWPQSGSLRDISAPLMSQVPVQVNVTIPCAVVRQLPRTGGMLLATAPPAGKDASLQSLFVRVSGDSVDVLDRNAVVATAPRAAMTRCSAIEISSDNTRTAAVFRGATGPDGKPLQGKLPGDFRPQVVGVFTDLTGPAPAGLSFHMTVDTRFTSAPTLTKWIAMVTAALCTLLSLVALARLDAADGRRHRRFLPAHWLRLTPLDGVVFGVLGIWHFVGANTSDDGYLLIMARVAPHAGYMANYFRWFGVPEAPFGWYYNVLEAFAKISTASPWMRVPTLLAAVLCWLVISREVAPRLGRGVRSSRVALWTGALVFLSFWLPYNNGLRPEPIVAVGALLTWCSVERAIGTGRMLPYAVACLVGAFTLAAAPTGLNCVVALIAGVKPMVRIVVNRRRELGLLPLLAPTAAAGFLVLTVVYNDQTFAGIQEANRVRKLIGPNLQWYEDYLRYYYLFVQTVDGSVSRRFAFLTMLLCLFTLLLMLLRRRRLPGIASSPTWRLMGVVFGTMFLMMFNPTKWTHHFGAYAGIAGALATVTAVAVSPRVLRSRRNRTVFLVGLLFVLAVTFSGINGYWYVSSYGVPWFDKKVSLHGYQSNTVFLVLFGLAMLMLAWQYLREDYASAETVRGKRFRAIAAAPLTVIAGAIVLFEVMSLAKGVVSQYPGYSLGRSNVQALSGNYCGLANDVLVESDANQGALRPLPGPLANPRDPLAGATPVNFSPNGIADDLSADAVPVKPGTGNTNNQSVGPVGAKGQNAGTDGGTGSRGINGSTAKLPFGLNPATTPVLGSYQSGVQQPASLTSSWYQLPARSADTPLIVITAAGRILSVGEGGATTYGQSLVVQYGKRQQDGSVKVQGSYLPRDVGPAPSWRNLRIPFSGISPTADAVRIVADDPILIGDQWLAFTPPRVPKLQTLNQLIGHDQPVLEDWAVGLQFPCQRPLFHKNGVAEVPGYRIKPDRPLAVSSTDTWQAEEFGGINGFAEMLADSITVPTYLKDDWARDWGSLERYDQYYDTVPAQVETGTVTRSGFWTPGKLRI